jgi:hypothetical protein
MSHHQAVEFILSRQNPDHGFGTYERTRGPAFLEKLNSTEMYAGCMTDFSHPEPTARLLPDRRPGLPPVQRHLPHLGPRGRIHRIRLTSSPAHPTAHPAPDTRPARGADHR